MEISSNIAKILEDTLLNAQKRLVFVTCFNSEKRKLQSISDSIDNSASQILIDPFNRKIRQFYKDFSTLLKDDDNMRKLNINFKKSESDEFVTLSDVCY